MLTQLPWSLCSLIRIEQQSLYDESYYKIDSGFAFQLFFQILLIMFLLCLKRRQKSILSLRRKHSCPKIRRCHLNQGFSTFITGKYVLCVPESILPIFVFLCFPIFAFWVFVTYKNNKKIMHLLLNG